ncbi:MAG: hypothetical protein ABFR05_08250 [Bacteroidota bacterium]
MGFFKKLSGKEFVTILILLLILFGFAVLKFVDFEPSESGESQIYTSVKTDKETCFNCHTENTGFSKYHDPENIGCVSCHLGDPKATDKDLSHKNMVLIPGNLADADATCGKCHTDELHKIKHSLMTTNSGLVAVDKFIFGEADSPDHHYDIRDIQFTGADKHLRDLCANCHLGAEKSEFGKIDQLSRGGGCNACHLNYSDKAVADLETYLNSDKKELPKVHPSTDIFVSNEHCFGCHSRSSRISTNYEGWHETLLDEEDVVGKEGFKVMQDKRVYSYEGEDVHHTKGLLCVDCHSSHEVMGTGKDYLHEEQAVTLDCADCHYKNKPNTVTYGELDAESSLVFLHRDYKHNDKKMLAVKKDGHPLVNTFVDENGDVFLIGKKDGKLHPIQKQSEVCSRDSAHKNVSCSTCHAQWSPRCIGCHNEFGKDDKNGYDLLEKKYVTGQWREHVFEFYADKPAMGVRENGEGRKIEPAIPGMILTIDHESFDENRKGENSFHRLYAPNSPHTISKAVRDCKSCHSNPAAIGYGNGKLIYDITEGFGKWVFTADFGMNPNDDLPEDAWIPFMGQQKAKIVSTRSDFRPFSVEEQKQLLLVGACLQCHKDDSKVMQQSLENGIAPLLLKVSKECVLPEE